MAEKHEAADMKGPTTIGDQGVTNYSQFASDGELNLFGTAKVIRHHYIKPEGFKLGGISPPALGLVGIYPTLDFDRNTEEEAYSSIHVPYRWDSITGLIIRIAYTHASDAESGVVRWGIEYNSKKAGELLTAGSVTIYQNSTVALNTGNDLIVQEFSDRILASNLEIDDVLGIRLFRDATHVDDTLDEDACFILLHVHFVMNKLGQAT